MSNIRDMIRAHREYLMSGGMKGTRAVIKSQNMDGMDLSMFDLAFITFEKCSMVGAKFRDARLENARFVECNIEGADFVGADLNEAVFKKVSGRASFDLVSYKKVG